MKNLLQEGTLLQRVWQGMYFADLWGDAAMGIWDSNTNVADPHVKAQQTAFIQSLEQLLQGNQLHTFCWRM